MKYKEFITEEQFYYLKDNNLLGALSRIIPEVLSIIEYEAFIDSLRYTMKTANKPVNWDFKEGTKPIHISWIIFGCLIDSWVLNPIGDTPAWWIGLNSFKEDYPDDKTDAMFDDHATEFPHQGLWDYLIKYKFIDLDKEKIDEKS